MATVSIFNVQRVAWMDNANNVSWESQLQCKGARLQQAFQVCRDEKRFKEIDSSQFRNFFENSVFKLLELIQFLKKIPYFSLLVR